MQSHANLFIKHENILLYDEQLIPEQMSIEYNVLNAITQN